MLRKSGSTSQFSCCYCSFSIEFLGFCLAFCPQWRGLTMWNEQELNCILWEWSYMWLCVRCKPCLINVDDNESDRKKTQTRIWSRKLGDDDFAESPVLDCAPKFCWVQQPWPKRESQTRWSPWQQEPARLAFSWRFLGLDSGEAWIIQGIESSEVGLGTYFMMSPKASFLIPFG